MCFTIKQIYQNKITKLDKPKESIQVLKQISVVSLAKKTPKTCFTINLKLIKIK